jgi:hypothetical protein
MFTLFLLLSHPAAWAADACEPLAELHSRVNDCADNPQYVPPATDCRDRFRTTMNEKYPVIQRELLAEANAGSDAAQNLKFGTTKNVYSNTDAELTALIDLGTRTLHEIEAYADDFVPPIPSWAPGHWDPDRRNPADPARDLNYYCWSEPMGNMDPLIADMQKMVAELTATRAKTRQLHGDTADRDGKLAVLASDSGPGANQLGFSGKKFENTPSTVTGQIKNEQLAGAESTSKLAPPPNTPAVDSPSDITARANAVPSEKGEHAHWVETYRSALRGGRDGKLGREISLPSLETAKHDGLGETKSPIAGATELVLEQLEKPGTSAGGGPGSSAPPTSVERALASVEPIAEAAEISPVSPLQEVRLAPGVAPSVQSNLERAADVRDLFQRAHSAYERSQRRQKI